MLNWRDSEFKHSVNNRPDATILSSNQVIITKSDPNSSQNYYLYLN